MELICGLIVDILRLENKSGKYLHDVPILGKRWQQRRWRKEQSGINK